MTIKRSRSIISTRHNGETTQSPEVQMIAAAIAEDCGDRGIAESVEMSTTLLTRIRQMFSNGGTIITDTSIMRDAIDSSLLRDTRVQLKCFIDNPEVGKLAEKKMTSRAEVAVDTALAVQGPKLMVIGSAPSALSRIISRRISEPMSDVYVMTAVSGFVSVVALKEKLRESNMTYGVIRGKNGGVAATAALVNETIKFIKKTK